MARNTSLHAANKAKYDEFYTQLPDIEKELKHYRKHFRGKTVYCNCDDPTISNFFQYFHLNFEKLGLKKLITTCYKNQQLDIFSRHDMEAAAGVEYVGNGTEYTEFRLKEDGDFRSPESIGLLKQADIVVTKSHPGPRAARPTRITVRCFVKSVTGRSPHNNQKNPCAQVKQMRWGDKRKP